MKLSDLLTAGLAASLIAYWLPLVVMAWRAGATSVAIPLTLLLALLAKLIVTAALTLAKPKRHELQHRPVVTWPDTH